MVADRTEALKTILKASALSIIVAAVPFIPIYWEFSFVLLYGAFLFCLPIVVTSILFVFLWPRVDASVLGWFCTGVAVCVVSFFLLFLTLNDLLVPAAFGSPHSIFLYFPIGAAIMFAVVSNRMIASRWG